MIEKNIKYYRIKNGLTLNELGEKLGITAMALSNYENGKRVPDMDVLKKLSKTLNIKLLDLLEDTSSNLNFQHGEFRKNNTLSDSKQNYIKDSIEKYISRFYQTVDILGNNVLEKPLPLHSIKVYESRDADGEKLREFLKVSPFGPISSLVEVIENNGIIYYELDIDDNSFAGINGTVNGRPYIAVNSRNSIERKRFTIVHELVHLFFIWNKDMSEKEIEKTVDEISACFLLPKMNMIRELGLRRKTIGNDMLLVCEEYGVSLSALVKRATTCRIISRNLEIEYFSKKNEKNRINKKVNFGYSETSTLFKQLVYRAICEEEISIQKGVELLRIPYETIYNECYGD